MCKKKVWECDPYMGHSRQWRIPHFHHIHKVLLFHYLCGSTCPTVHPPPPPGSENGVVGVVHCRFIHRHARKISKTFPESSFPSSFNGTSFSSQGLFWAEQSLFEDAEMNHKEHFSAETVWIVFSALNDDCPAQDRPRELKLICLELRMLNMSLNKF